jgi:ATP/maltotriose-dependent transcriptional regulator MalT
MMSLQERERALSAYRAHAAQFSAIATRRARGSSAPASEVTAGRAVGDEIPTPLSDRELDVLTLVASGLSNGEIGGRLCITEETVKTHVRHVLAKLQARNRAQAVALGFRRGVISAAGSD